MAATISVSNYLDTLCVSLNRDIDLHPPLFMTTLPIDEVDVLKILGIHFDCKLLWSHMIDQLATRCHQHLGALYRIRDYLGQSGIVTPLFDQYVEYGGVIFMGAGASVTHLQKLDSVQQAPRRMCQVTLSSHQKASAIGLLCKLLDGQYRGPISAPSYSCHTYLSPATCYLVIANIDTIHDQFPGLIYQKAIPSIWASLPLTLRERCAVEGWTTVHHIATAETLYCMMMLHTVNVHI